MQFERDGTADEPLTHESGNPWYLFVPPAIVSVWLVVAVARLVVWTILPADAAAAEDSGVIGDVLQGADLLGWIGWVLLFVFYFVLLSRRRRSRWWALGGFCCGLNLLLYAVLLFLPSRRNVVTAPPFQEPEVFGTENHSHLARSVLRDSFVCDGCDSLLNFGVSECDECGERYIYSDGKAGVDESARRRR